VGEPQLNDEGTVAIVFVTPESAPQDEETDKLVDRLRGDVVPAATAGGDALAYVSGQTTSSRGARARTCARGSRHRACSHRIFVQLLARRA